ncbi:hypothetical protein B0H15DRAFT_861921 [Mycena belliarum]|uniref:F-box domain-containing protein n=1 Tax=Mycena belliarum TaxID=1033014 RepID=A0AAD6XIR9_9AGAR|nr:hypothetical protein B0H15DRAFT_861921 [Mycena belliae]
MIFVPVETRPLAQAASALGSWSIYSADSVMTHPQSCLIGILPVEILLGCFHLLDGKSLVWCCSVCRVWRETIKNCTELNYIIELLADGMLPGPSSLSSSEKMEHLSTWRKAWHDMKWKSRTEFAINEHPRAYELVGGVFAQQNTWPESDFTAIRLPSSQHSGEIASTRNIGIESLDFAMDPTQDLVVFLHRDQDDCGSFDCRSMSSLQPHPRASTPRLSFDLRNDNLRRIFLQVADDIIGLLFHTSLTTDGTLRVVLLNWCTGTMLVDLTSSNLSLSVSDFALISPCAFLLGCTGRRNSAGEIHIYRFQRTHHNDPTRVATLELPPIDPHRSLDRLIAHSGPFCASLIAGAQFSKANDKRICAISLAYDQAEFYSLYVHHRYFERYLSVEGEPPTVPWDQWGPNHARIMTGRHRFWLRYVHGERVVRPVDPDHPTRVEILDFGITPSRPGNTVGPELCVDPSTIPRDGHVFKDDVTTSLPYRHTVHYLDDHYILFMIDQDRLIGVNEMVNKLTVYTF